MGTQVTTTTFVVRDHAGRLIVAFWGNEAEAEAENWVGRGYLVETLLADDPHPAAG